MNGIRGALFFFLFPFRVRVPLNPLIGKIFAWGHAPWKPIMSPTLSRTFYIYTYSLFIWPVVISLSPPSYIISSSYYFLPNISPLKDAARSFFYYLLTEEEWELLHAIQKKIQSNKKKDLSDHWYCGDMLKNVDVIICLLFLINKLSIIETD